ncbi:MAG TPA: LysR family transcriptional regulator [Terriglobia bacterium]|nr:LysR family transcriptional regulator [Terriglobia bacterium]
MRGLNLDQLAAFTQVIEHGSFSAAASRLNLTQPAVSQQVRQLEEKLGLRLLERVGRRATPTEAGTALLIHARNIDAAVTAALDAMAQQASGALGRVRLGTGSTALLYMLPPILRDLKQRFPTLEISVNTGNTVDTLKALAENSLDLGLVVVPVTGRSFSVTPVADDEFVAIEAADANLLPARVTPAALAKLPMLLDEPNSQSHRVISDWFRRHGQTPKPVMQLGSVETIKELVGAGLGCAVVPRIAVPGKSGEGRGGDGRGNDGRANEGRANEGRGGRSSLAAGDGRPLLRWQSLSPRLYRRIALVMRRDKVMHRGLREVYNALLQLKKQRRVG